MTCRTLHALLSASGTDGLPRESREAFAHHLGACASCRAYVDSYEKTRLLARAAEREAAEPAPEALVRTILA